VAEAIIAQLTIPTKWLNPQYLALKSCEYGKYLVN